MYDYLYSKEAVIEAARELDYPDSVISALSKAGSQKEMEKIMSSARRAA